MKWPRLPLEATSACPKLRWATAGACLERCRSGHEHIMARPARVPTGATRTRPPAMAPAPPAPSTRQHNPSTTLRALPTNVCSSFATYVHNLTHVHSWE